MLRAPRPTLPPLPKPIIGSTNPSLARERRFPFTLFNRQTLFSWSSCSLPPPPPGALGANVWTCTAKIPAVLHVNSEARAVGLRRYRLGLAPGNTQPRIYVDLTRDVIGLSEGTILSPVARNLWRLTSDLRHARRLALARASASWFIGLRQQDRLDEIDELVLVDSMLFRAGVVPRVAQLDWEHWVRWQGHKGAARWAVGGDPGMPTWPKFKTILPIVLGPSNNSLGGNLHDDL